MTRTKQSELAPILTALERIENQARWAFVHGMWKAGKGLTAERGVVHQPRHSNDDIDFVPGNTWDIDEGGNANARAAYRRTVEAVVNARSVVEVILAVLVERPSEHVRLEGSSPHPDQLCAAINELRENCRKLPEGDLPAKREVRHAGRLLDAAAAALDRAVGAPVEVDQGPDKRSPEHRLCRVCEWRVVSKKAGGTRCDVCKKHFQRHGVERPGHLDGIDPREAKRKRQARGEDFGAG